MNFNKKYLGITFVIVLLAFIANYSFQNNFQKKTDRKRNSSRFFSKNEVMKNILMARQKDLKFLEVVEMKLSKNELKGRESMIYAEALALYNSEKSTSLMWEMFKRGDLKVHNRILKGLGERKGDFNKKLLLKIYKKRNDFSKLEKIYLYIAMYRQYDQDKYRQESLGYLKQYLDLNKTLENLVVLRFFQEEKIYSKQVVAFSKTIVMEILNGRRISPVLLSLSIKVLVVKDFQFVVSHHSKIMKISNPLYIRYYIPTLRYSCIPGITKDMLDRISEKDLSFNIFRPLAAELQFFGGDLIFSYFEKLVLTKNLSQQKQRYLKELMTSFQRGKQVFCAKDSN